MYFIIIVLVWIDLYYNGRNAGKLCIGLQFNPNMNMGMMGVNGGMGMMNPMMGGGMNPMMGGGMNPMMGGMGMNPMMGGMGGGMNPMNNNGWMGGNGWGGYNGW